MILGKIRYSFSGPLVSLDVVKTKTSEGARITFDNVIGTLFCSPRGSQETIEVSLTV